MDRFVYIHGFNSSACSRSGHELSQLLGVPVICPEYDYSRPFAECLSSIQKQIVSAIDGRIDRLCVMGSSLGGFYALQLRHPSIIHVVAWNPVVFPAMQLEQFLGHNVRFSDGQAWEFHREAMLSYAQAPDPRPWHNEIWRREQLRIQDEKELNTPVFNFGGSSAFTLLTGDKSEKNKNLPLAGCPNSHMQSAPRRDIFIGDRDTILDGRLTRAFWQRSARLHDIVSSHQIADYSHALSILKKGKLLDSFTQWQPGADWAASFCEAGNYGMAGLVAVRDKLDEVRRLFWLADEPFLELSGEKDGRAYPLVMAFFHPCHEEKMRRLLAGLARLCGQASYVLLSADGRAVRHQIAANRLMDAEYLLPLYARTLTSVLEAGFSGWKGLSAEWNGHQRHGSFMQAMMRNQFASKWEQSEDPVAAWHEACNLGN